MEDTFTNIKNALLRSFENFGNGIAEYVPIVISALVILLVGWIVAKLVSKTLHKALELIKLDHILAKVKLDKLLAKIKSGLSPAKILAKIVYYLLMLLFITSASEVLGWTMITEGITAFIGYLPTLGVALVIFVIGVYIAELIQNMVYTAANSIGVSGAKAISNIVYYVLMIFVAVTALNQAQIDTDIITSNITLIIGSILIAFAISYGFASRDIVTNMLSSYYGKGKYQEGQRVRIGEVEGVIQKIDSLSITLKTKDGQEVIPSRKMIESQITILDDETE
ncbi:MAG: mechanosensitive ion channel [Flavobacteriales bacterium]|nr:mechanosensitive ion channel [Flavobacteriales bacterium]